MTRPRPLVNWFTQFYNLYGSVFFSLLLNPHYHKPYEMSFYQNPVTNCNSGSQEMAKSKYGLTRWSHL